MNIGINIKEIVFRKSKWAIYLVTEIFAVSCGKCYAEKKFFPQHIFFSNRLTILFRVGWQQLDNFLSLTLQDWMRDNRFCVDLWNIFRREHIPLCCVNYPLLTVCLLSLCKKHIFHWIWNFCKQSLTIVTSFFTIKSTFLFRSQNNFIIIESYVTSCLVPHIRETGNDFFFQRRICWTQNFFIACVIMM